MSGWRGCWAGIELATIPRDSAWRMLQQQQRTLQLQGGDAAAGPRTISALRTLCQHGVVCFRPAFCLRTVYTALATPCVKHSTVQPMGSKSVSWTRRKVCMERGPAASCLPDARAATRRHPGWLPVLPRLLAAASPTWPSPPP